MRLLKGVLGLLVAGLLLLGGILLTVNNQAQVAVDLVFVQFPQASLARWLILSFLIGVLLSLVLGMGSLLALKSRLRQAHRKLRRHETELDRLRATHIESNH